MNRYATGKVMLVRTAATDGTMLLYCLLGAVIIATTTNLSRNNGPVK